MEVFLIWSGDVSHAVAQALHNWIPKVIQTVRPFLSSEDIRKGNRWNHDLARKLESVKWAIACLTPHNLDAPWIHFEAGAISKYLDIGKVTALLFNVDQASVQGPLVQFQNTQATNADILQLMKSLNAELGDGALDDARLVESFETYWPQLEKALTAASKLKPAAPQAARPTGEIAEEVLQLTRDTSRQLAQIVSTQERLTNIVDQTLQLQTSASRSRIVGGPIGLGHDDHSARSYHDKLAAIAAGTPLPLREEERRTALVKALRSRNDRTPPEESGGTPRDPRDKT